MGHNKSQNSAILADAFTSFAAYKCLFTVCVSSAFPAINGCTVFYYFYSPALARQDFSA